MPNPLHHLSGNVWVEAWALPFTPIEEMRKHHTHPLSPSLSSSHAHTRTHTHALSLLPQAGEFDLKVTRRGMGFAVHCAPLHATVAVEGTQTRVDISDDDDDDDDSHDVEENGGTKGKEKRDASRSEAHQDPADTLDHILSLASDFA